MDVRVGSQRSLNAEEMMLSILERRIEEKSWRRLLRVPRTARRSNHSILKEINPEYSLEEQMVDAEAPIFWPPDVKS